MLMSKLLITVITIPKLPKFININDNYYQLNGLVVQSVYNVFKSAHIMRERTALGLEEQAFW
ncbi:hypothetical protein PALB_23250 [Pseudoalteromonas luteoviolacea B = ATCC 29581]|nr:hypothetical protein PALB_23250 [Pseudoalteromonas luteoviolacea B = ATCC 29581]